MQPDDVADDATFFLATFDLGGAQRVRALRRRFPYMPIATYSESPADAEEAKREGADGHTTPDAFELAWLIRGDRRATGPADEGRHGERLIRGLVSSST